MKCKCQNEMTQIYEGQFVLVYHCKHCGMAVVNGYKGIVWHEPHFTVDVKTEYKVTQ